MKQYRILIVEDDFTVSSVLKKSLEKWDYVVHVPTRFDRILDEFRDFQPDIALMDISLPYFDGFHWSREIRKFSTIPILFLSSAGDDMATILALNSGADEFISKPFRFEVLLARIQAMLRRCYDMAPSVKLSFGDLKLDPSTGTMTRNGTNQSATLTRTEMLLLKALMEAGGRVMTRDELTRKTWETDHFISENTLSVNVNRLRKKLEQLDIRQLVVTVPGSGYLLRKEES